MLRPVYLIVGEERHLASQVVSVLRRATLVGGVEGLNEDTLDAPQASVDQLLAVARTLPMLAPRRWVLSRNIETWDSEKKSKSNKTEEKKAGSPLDALLSYAKKADPSTVMVLVAGKLDKRRKLYTAAKKDGYLVECDTPKRHELPSWIRARVSQLGNEIEPSVADLIAELSGPELSSVADALERLSLFVGEGKPITEDAVAECVVRLRAASVWELVSAVGERNISASLKILQDVYDPADRGLRLLGVLAWATRQLIKFDDAARKGASPQDAAKAAGAPPFKARELAQQVRSLPQGTLSSWIERLAETDLALKGATKRPPRAVLEQMLMDLCRAA